MTTKNLKLAMGCKHNYLWICKHPELHGQSCIGPCNFCTTTQLNADSIICTICDSPVESGYCLNIKCVNHGS